MVRLRADHRRKASLLLMARRAFEALRGLGITGLCLRGRAASRGQPQDFKLHGAIAQRHAQSLSDAHFMRRLHALAVAATARGRLRLRWPASAT